MYKLLTGTLQGIQGLVNKFRRVMFVMTDMNQVSAVYCELSGVCWLKKKKKNLVSTPAFTNLGLRYVDLFACFITCFLFMQYTITQGTTS